MDHREHGGYYYKINKTRGDKLYLKCATPNVYCKGSAIKNGNGPIVPKKTHSHDAYGPEYHELETKNIFRSTLVERARSETIELKVIYDQEAIRNPHAAGIYSWPTAESSMRYARRSTLPPLPSTLRELSEFLDMNVDRYQCDNSRFYQEWMVDRDGKYSVMFACNDLISAVINQGANELHADGTFKVVPSTPHCRQLFIIHLILQNHSIPVCYVLMEAKTEASYRKVLERFKIKYPEVRPVSIMIDFETALRQVFVDTYPEAHVYSCWFHYVQSLQKNIRKMGYSRYIQQNREAKMCLKMCAVLALLPAHQIEMGFQEIKNHAQNNGVLLPRFFTYMSSFWLSIKGPECFSVYGQPRRTNNNVESFHSTLQQTFQVAHPNLWKMLDHLKTIAVKQHIVVTQLAAGLTTSRSVKFKYILNSMRIKNSTALLSTGAITVKEFLIQCSHCTDRYLSTELNWHDATDDSEDEIQNNDGILNAPIPAVEDAAGVVDPQFMVIAEDLVPVAENNIEPVVNVIEDYDDMDFIIPEDGELNIWQQFRNDADEEEEITFVEVPRNLYELYPPVDETNICIVCRMEERTHALIPCGHRVLCVDCVTQLQAQRCPLCNSDFDMVLRIW